MNSLQDATRHQHWNPPTSGSFRLVNAQSKFIDQIFESKSLPRRDGSLVPLDVFIPQAQGDLLYSLVRFLKPKSTLEVGLANGISALHIALALRDNGSGHHLAIDPFQQSDWCSVGLISLERAGLDHLVTLDARPSHWSLPDLDEAGKRVQFAFIDGSHVFDYVMTDFMVVDRILDVGGLIAFDDSDWQAINKVIRFALTNRDYQVFDPGVVIEPSPGRPGLPARCLRTLVRRSKSLRRVVREDFTYPSRELGIDGRCVVLQKLADDQRHSLRRQLVEF